MKPLLSLCMIIKNEEKSIKRCLDSVQGIVDEIIIVDTGSEDKSVEISLRYTNNVFEYKWEDDFSKARNFAASKASGRWIMVLDGDEYIDRNSLQNFKEQLRKTNHEHTNIYIVQIVNFMGEHGEGTSLNYHERIYKNNNSIYYYRNVHEMLKHSNGNEISKIASFQIFHTGYLKENMKGKIKSQRNLNLLKKKKNKEPVDYFFIGNEYYSLQNYERAIIFYQKGYKTGNIRYEWVPKLLVKLISSLQHLNRHKDAYKVILESEKTFPKLVDFTYLKGKKFLDENNNQKAISIFKGILEKKDSLSAVFSEDFLEYLPHGHLGELYERKYDYPLAVKHYSMAISMNDLNNYLWSRLITLIASTSNEDELIQFINNNVLNRKTMTAIRFINILLNVSDIRVQRLLRNFDDKKSLLDSQRDALLLKNCLLSKELSLLYKNIINKSLLELKGIFESGIFNLIDFIYVALKLENNTLSSMLNELNKSLTIDDLKEKMLSKTEISPDDRLLLEALKKKAELLEDKNFLLLLDNSYTKKSKKITQ